MDINRNNFESFFLLYTDRELSPADMQSVEKFLNENTDLQKEFDLLQQTIFSPADIVFNNKDSLLRHEEKRRVIPINRMRMAAAVTVLILGSWFIISQNSKNNINPHGTAEQGIASHVKKPDASGAFNTDSVNLNSTSQKKDAGTANGNKTSNQVDESGIAKNNIPGKTTKIQINRKNVRQFEPEHSDQKNPQDNMEAQTNLNSDEAGLALQKSSTALEIQSAAIGPDRQTKQIMNAPAVKTPVLLVAVSESKDQPNNENGGLKDYRFQNDNAISVIALNDKNKAISGFFKKLTRRAPEDENERKVRVSVFQFSY